MALVEDAAESVGEPLREVSYRGRVEQQRGRIPAGVMWRDAYRAAVGGVESFLEPGCAQGLGKALNTGRADAEGTRCIDESEAETQGRPLSWFGCDAGRSLQELKEILGPADIKMSTQDINMTPIQLEIWRETMRYGIGKHANQAQDTGRGDLIFHTKFPLGTDPDALERWFEDEAIRRGLIKGDGLRRQDLAQPQKPHPGKIFNRALLRAVGHKETPPEVKAALQTEDGDELQLVGDEMPPDPNEEPIE